MGEQHNVTSVNPLDLVREVHAQYRPWDPPLTDEEAGYILWEFTGFPSFFFGDPVEYFSAQLHEFFNFASTGHVPCMRCGARAPQRERVCGPCDDLMMAEYASEAVAS